MAIGLELTDGTGRVWPLTEHSNPALRRGVQGLGMPTMEPYKGVDSPSHGRRWTGWRATERLVVLPLHFRGPGLVATRREFVAGTVPDQHGTAGTGPCRLTATMPDSSVWSVDMRLVDDGRLQLDLDPDLVGWLKPTLSWDADVFWAGSVWSSTWQAAAPAAGSWLLGPGGGGVARLSAGHTLSTASATNAGDVRVWPVWTVAGPCTWLSVGVGDLQVSGSVTLGAGESLTIDTDPEDGQMAVHSSGADWTDRLDEVGFAPLEPGLNQLAVTMTGTGTVSMAFRPLRLALL